MGFSNIILGIVLTKENTMKRIALLITVVAILLINGTSESGICKSAKWRIINELPVEIIKEVTFTVFDSKERAVEFAKENKISLNNITHESRYEGYWVWDHLPDEKANCNYWEN